MKKTRNLAMYYFILTYITTILLTRPSPQVQKIRTIIWSIPFIIWGISFLMNIIRRDKLAVTWFERSKKANIYFLILGIVMVVTNIFSLNVFYSIYSGLFSVALLGVMFNVIGTLLIQINNNSKHKKNITIQLLIILSIAILGEMIFDSWNWDNTVRFSGGINPNMMAFISLFCFIWFLDLKIDKEFPIYSTLGIIMSIITLIWTLSRGRIIVFVFLIFYLIATFFFILANPKLQYKFNKKRAMLNAMLGIILLIFTVSGIYIALNSQAIWDRLSTPIDTRRNVWILLKMGFEDNILFGSFGWWNSNDVIRQHSDINIASSAHNFYLRVLSEIGIIGLVALMFFPVILVFKSLKKAIFNKNIDKSKRKKLLLYSGANLAFFISQFAEDQYMNGIGDFQTGLFAWILTLNYYYLIDNNFKVIKNDLF